jgi:hypothetical protein
MFITYPSSMPYFNKSSYIKLGGERELVEGREEIWNIWKLNRILLDANYVAVLKVLEYLIDF